VVYKLFYSGLFNRNSRFLLKRYIFTGIVELLVMIAYVISFKLSSLFWGEIGFAEYSLVRRTLALLIPILFLGFDIEIPRRMAYGHENDQDSDAISYFINGCAIVFITVLISACILLSGSHLFGRLFFGDSSYSKLIKPLILIVIGFSLHALCYAYFRGILKIKYANLIHLNTFGIILLLSFLIL